MAAATLASKVHQALRDGSGAGRRRRPGGQLGEHLGIVAVGGDSLLGGLVEDFVLSHEKEKLS